MQRFQEYTGSGLVGDKFEIRLQNLKFYVN